MPCAWREWSGLRLIRWAMLVVGILEKIKGGLETYMLIGLHNCNRMH